MGEFLLSPPVPEAADGVGVAAEAGLEPAAQKGLGPAHPFPGGDGRQLLIV